MPENWQIISKFVAWFKINEIEMRKGFNILLIFGMVLVAMACGNKTKSYTDMLNAEKKAINNLISSEGLEILKNYPSDGVFKENQFVKLANDVYINVVDTGNGNRAELYQTDVYARFRANFIRHDSVILSNYGPNSNGTFPVEFKYGYYSATTSTGDGLSDLVSEGMQLGLEFVGDGGKVKLIVPFKRGSSWQQYEGDPVYFEILEYKFVDRE